MSPLIVPAIDFGAEVWPVAQADAKAINSNEMTYLMAFLLVTLIHCDFYVSLEHKRKTPVLARRIGVHWFALPLLPS